MKFSFILLIAVMLVNLPVARSDDGGCVVKRDVEGGTILWQELDSPHATVPGKTHRDLLPGQKVNLKLIPPEGKTVAKISWAIDGDTFKDWTANQDTAELTELDAGDLDDETVHFYWCSAGTIVISCTATLNDRTRVQITENFIVEKPEVLLLSTMGTTKITQVPDPNTGRFVDAFGLFGNARGEPGIKFSGVVFISSGWPRGKWNWVQLIKANREATIRGRDFEMSLNGQTVLDSTYPYDPGPPGKHPGAADGYSTGTIRNPQRLKHDMELALETTNDSPHCSLTTETARSIDDTWTTYIMFLPPGDNSRYVPTEYITWEFNMSVTLRQGSWVILDANQDLSNAYETTTHPTWSNNITGASWQPKR